MKNKPKLTAIALAAVAILTVIIILSVALSKDKITELENAGQVYASAAEQISTAPDLSVHISRTQTTTVGSDTFTEVSQQTLTYYGAGTEAMLANAQESFSIDDYTVHFSEVYADGTAYLSIENSQFSSKISSADYLARFAPAVLFDTQLYGSITGISDGEAYTITFAQPSAAESWAFSDGFEFLDASGTAYISSLGQLQRSEYSVTCQRGEAVIRLQISVEISSATEEVQVPDTSGYVSIEYLDGPRQLERATGYLLRTGNISATYRDSTFFQAFGDERAQQITLYTHNADTWSALLNTAVTLTNSSRIDEVSQLLKTELFLNDSYRLFTDGTETAPSTAVNADTMLTYCQNLLVGTIMLPQYITGAQLTETENAWHISYSASDTFAALISSEACKTLYQDGSMLDTLTQSSTTEKMECYLELDKTTGLPLASGIHYSGTYTIEGVPYQLRFEADQVYDLICDIAYEEINKAAGA